MFRNNASVLIQLIPVIPRSNEVYVNDGQTAKGRRRLESLRNLTLQRLAAEEGVQVAADDGGGEERRREVGERLVQPVEVVVDEHLAVGRRVLQRLGRALRHRTLSPVTVTDILQIFFRCSSQIVLTNE